MDNFYFLAKRTHFVPIHLFAVHYFLWWIQPFKVTNYQYSVSMCVLEMERKKQASVY